MLHHDTHHWNEEKNNTQRHQNKINNSISSLCKQQVIPNNINIRRTKAKIKIYHCGKGTNVTIAY